MLNRDGGSIVCTQVHARCKNCCQARMLLSTHNVDRSIHDDSRHCLVLHDLIAKRMHIMYSMWHMSHKQTFALLKHNAVTIETADKTRFTSNQEDGWQLREPRQPGSDRLPKHFRNEANGFK